MDELFAVVPERDPVDEGTALRDPLAKYLLKSETYRSATNVTMSVRDSLIERGVRTLADIDLWPDRGDAPDRSPCAWFLTEVWRQVWAESRLGDPGA